ncbi:MAG TPA: hypothetical protein VGW40_11680 [Allosphingosinicella sp.]|nr:hypothetical protein [Allosphingosinicella sp.]
MEKPSFRLSRRKVIFIVGGAATAVGALLTAATRSLVDSQASSQTGGSASRTTVDLATAGYDTWLAQVGTKFSTAGYDLKLVGIAPLLSTGARPAGLRDRAFALNFDVAAGRTMAGELIYTISHPQYGPLQLFLSATGPQTPSRMLAVLN